MRQNINMSTRGRAKSYFLGSEDETVLSPRNNYRMQDSSPRAQIPRLNMNTFDVQSVEQVYATEIPNF